MHKSSIIWYELEPPTHFCPMLKPYLSLQNGDWTKNSCFDEFDSKEYLFSWLTPA